MKQSVIILNKNQIVNEVRKAEAFESPYILEIRKAKRRNELKEQVVTATIRFGLVGIYLIMVTKLVMMFVEAF